MVLALGCAAPLALAAAVRALARRLPPPGGPRPGRLRAAFALVAAGAVGLAVAAHQRGPAFQAGPGELVISFLEIGQGDATLIQRDGASILVDTGPAGGPIVRRLRESGVRRLDALVITHAQADHEGEALAVMRAFSPRLLLDGGAGWPTGVQRRARRGAARRARARASTPAPASGSSSRASASRCCGRPRRRRGGGRPGTPTAARSSRCVRCGSFDLLLPADAESDVTAALAPAARRGAEGRPPRQRRRGAARPCWSACAPPSPRSRSGAATRTGIRPRRRWPRCAACRASCGPIGTAPCGCACRGGRCDWSGAVRRCGSDGSAGPASRLGRRAQLQGRLPDSRRRPRPDRRAPQPPAGDGRDRERDRRASRCSRPRRAPPRRWPRRCPR